MGVPNGVENVVHTLERLLIYGTTTRYALKVDIANAFNSVDRRQVLRQLYAQPSLAKLWLIAEWAYGSWTPLLTWDTEGRRTSSLTSSQGVRQGDPLSPALFALAALPHFQQAREAAPGVVALALLDDLTLVSDNWTALRAGAESLEGASADGLVVQQRKTVFFAPTPGPIPEECTTWLQQSGIRLERDSLDILGATLSKDGVHLLEAAINRINDYDQLFFEGVDEDCLTSQDGLILLSKCGVPKPNYILRTTPPRFAADAAAVFTEKVHRAALAKLGINGHELTPAARSQLTLPPKLGGLGLPDFTELSGPAWLASQAAAAPLIAALVPAEEGTTPEFRDIYADACARVRAHCPDGGPKLAHFLPNDGDINNFVPAELKERGGPHELQRKLTQLINAHKLGALLAHATPQDKARLLSVSAPGGGHFLNAKPGDTECAIRPGAFCTAVRIRLGLPPTKMPFKPNPTCGLCFQHDVSATHGLDCPQLKRVDTLWRHDRVQALLVRACRALGGLVTVEHRISHENRKKPDLRIQLDGRLYYVDVVITNALAPSHLKVAQNKLGAASQAEKTKHRKYGEEIKRQGAKLFAFSLEATGAFGKEAQEFLGVLQRAYKPELATMTWDEVRRLLTHGVACTVQEYNAAIMDRWLGAANVLEEVDWEELAEAKEAEEEEEPEEEDLQEQAEAA